MGELGAGENIEERIKVGLTPSHLAFLDELVEGGAVDNRSEAIRKGVDLIWAMNNQEALVLEGEEANGVLGIAAEHDVHPGEAAEFSVFLYAKVRDIDEGAIDNAWEDFQQNYVSD